MPKKKKKIRSIFNENIDQLYLMKIQICFLYEEKFFRYVFNENTN